MRVLRSRVINEGEAEVKSSKKRKSVARRMTQDISINDGKFAEGNSVLKNYFINEVNEDREETVAGSTKLNRTKKDRKKLSKNAKGLAEVKNMNGVVEVKGRRTRNSVKCSENVNTSHNEEKSKKEDNVLENGVIDTFKQFEKKINHSINFHETKKLSFDKKQEDQIEENTKNEAGSSSSSAYNTPSERNRKKWLKFDRDSVDAMQLLGEISKLNDSRRKSSRSSPQKKGKNVLNETFQVTNIPKVEGVKVQKPKKLEDSVKMSRTKLPNFALIHKKAYEKMESLVDYSERKKKRFMEISRTKESKVAGRIKFEEVSKPTDDKAPKLRASLGWVPKESQSIKVRPALNRTLLPRPQNKPLGLQKENTFTINKKSAIPVAAPKQPVFSRPDTLAVANKQRAPASTMEKKRQLIKNVRTNKRFDLLMSMRNRKA